MVSGSFLVISPALPEDQGTYTCTASNEAGTDSSSANLNFFSASNVVLVEVEEFSNPNAENTCHLVNQGEFEVSKQMLIVLIVLLMV